MTVSESESEFLRDWQRMADEPLSPALEPYVEASRWGRMLRHPLVYEVPLTVPGFANRRLLEKERMLDEALAAGDLGQVVFLHEKPWRFYALERYVLECDGETGEPLTLWEQPEEIAELALEVWINSENVSQNREGWTRLFDGRPNGAVLGDADDRAAFAALPERLTVYRAGYGGSSGVFSWTTDREVAERLLGGYSSFGTAFLAEREIDRADVLAYLTGRGESEVIVYGGEGRVIRRGTP